MSMDEVKKLMEEAKWGDLATTDGETVGCRPMGGWAWFADELWCATFRGADKVAQLAKVPCAEYCFATPDGRHARITGECTISTDNDDKIALYEAVPVLANHIEDPTSPEYVVIRMKPDRVRLLLDPDGEYEEVEPPAE